MDSPYCKHPVVLTSFGFTIFISLYFFSRHAGTIYAFLFSSDIINNLMVAALQKYLRETYGYLGLFLIVSIWGLVALTATLFYPRNPGPEKGRHSVDKSRSDHLIICFHKVVVVALCSG